MSCWQLSRISPAQANKTRGELIETFHKKRHLFEEKLVTFTPNTEGAQPVKEAQSDIQSTVGKEIAWVSGVIAKALDVSHQVDIANRCSEGRCCDRGR